MKKTLLVTSALVAAGLFSSEAFAQAKPMSLTIGGFYVAHIVAVDQDSQAAVGGLASGGGFQSTDKAITDSGEIHFKGSLPLDNGITVGFHMEMELMTHQDQIDEGYLTFAGSFGRFMIGQNDPVGREMGRGAPSANRATGEAFGINENGIQTAPVTRAGTAFANFAGSAGDRQANAAAGGGGGNNRGLAGAVFSTVGALNQGDGEELFYQTPNFSGFVGYAMWKPRTVEFGFEQAAVNINNATNLFGDLFGVAISYDGKFGDVAVRAGAAWESGDPQSTFTLAGTAFNLDGRQNGYNGHLLFNVAGFDFGGSVRYVDFDLHSRAGGVALAATDRREMGLLNFDLGVAYTFNPFKVGLTYFNGSDETFSNAPAAGEVNRQAYMLSGSYQLGPGVFMDAGVIHERLEAKSGVVGVANQTLDSTGIYISAGVNF
jgi:outer membrane protein OmpU